MRSIGGPLPAKGMIAAMPRRRIGKPEVMDGLLLLLASGKSDDMTGTLIAVDDG